MTITPDPILTAAEVAADLRCSKAHVHKLINGVLTSVPPLPAIHMGRRLVVRRSTLEKWKEQVENVVAGVTLEASPNVDAADALRSNQ